jgi:hypothetical protein
MFKFLISVILLFTILIIQQVNAQETKPATDTVTKKDTSYWTKGGFSSLTFNQVTLKNWSAGGENALSATALLNLYANYKKNKIVWDNSLDLGYGILKSDVEKLRKNEDKIDLLSKFGYKAIKKLYYSALFNYKTQFAEGFNYPNDSTVVSKFNAPAYINISLGLDYKPNNYFSLYVSPASGKFTIVNDNALSGLGMYGVEPGKKVRSEFGASMNASFKKDVVKNVNIISKLSLFDNYTDKDKTNRSNVDVNWEVMINIKAGKYLTTSITTNLIYDDNVIKRTQFKEALGVGASVKF